MAGTMRASPSDGDNDCTQLLLLARTRSASKFSVNRIAKRSIRTTKSILEWEKKHIILLCTADARGGGSGGRLYTRTLRIIIIIISNRTSFRQPTGCDAISSVGPRSRKQLAVSVIRLSLTRQLAVVPLSALVSGARR